jgi:hypothetical protein
VTSTLKMQPPCSFVTLIPPTGLHSVIVEEVTIQIFTIVKIPVLIYLIRITWIGHPCLGSVLNTQKLLWALPDTSSSERNSHIRFSLLPEYGNWISFWNDVFLVWNLDDDNVEDIKTNYNIRGYPTAWTASQSLQHTQRSWFTLSWKFGMK